MGLPEGWHHIPSKENDLNKHLLALAVSTALCLAMTPAFAADTKPADTTKAAATKSADTKATDTKAENSQQNKMKTCQAQAGEKKLEGSARQTYVNECLKAKPAKKESKMTECNRKTAGLKGEERSKAQSECMKGG